MAESNLERKGFISFSISRPSPREVGQKLKQAGTEAESMDECCLLFCSFYLTQLAFLYTADHVPGGGTICVGLGSSAIYH